MRWLNAARNAALPPRLASGVCGASEAAATERCDAGGGALVAAPSTRQGTAHVGRLPLCATKASMTRA